MANKETIMMGCENWVKNHKGEEVTLEYSAIVELLDVLKEQDGIIDSLKSDLHETLDVVTNRKNVTMCKDCKHGRQYDTNAVDCEYRELATEPDWFCADGSPKEVK